MTLTPLQKAQIAGLVRWLLGMAGAYGLTVSEALTLQIISFVIAAIPAVWSYVQKRAVNRKIQGMAIATVEARLDAEQAHSALEHERRM